MEQKYIYRVLRENEITDKGLGLGLYSKAFNIQTREKSYSFSNALDNITTHIMRGNIAETEFISCSKDLKTDLRKYATEQLDIRPNLAVIENHSKSTIESVKFDIIKQAYDIADKYANAIYNEGKYELVPEFENLVKNHEVLKFCYEKMMSYEELHRWRVPKVILLGQISALSQKDIDKFVIDASIDIHNDELYKFFKENGFIFNKSGNVKECVNLRESGTAKNSSEVLVLNHIKRSDFTVLNPLQYDILYSLVCSKPSVYEKIDEELIKLLELFSTENFGDIAKIFKTDLGRTMLDMLYKDRNTIYNIIESTNQIETFKTYKKMFLSQCIDHMNKYYNVLYSTDFIYILESNIDFYNSPVVKVENGKILKKTR